MGSALCSRHSEDEAASSVSSTEANHQPAQLQLRQREVVIVGKSHNDAVDDISASPEGQQRMGDSMDWIPSTVHISAAASDQMAQESEGSSAALTSNSSAQRKKLHTRASSGQRHTYGSPPPPHHTNSGNSNFTSTTATTTANSDVGVDLMGQNPFTVCASEQYRSSAHPLLPTHTHRSSASPHPHDGDIPAGVLSRGGAGGGSNSDHRNPFRWMGGGAPPPTTTALDETNGVLALDGIATFTSTSGDGLDGFLHMSELVDDNDPATWLSDLRSAGERRGFECSDALSVDSYQMESRMMSSMGTPQPPTDHDARTEHVHPLATDDSNITRPPSLSPKHAAAGGSGTALIPSRSGNTPPSATLEGPFFNPSQWDTLSLPERLAAARAMATKIKSDIQQTAQAEQLRAKGWRRRPPELVRTFSSSAGSTGTGRSISFVRTAVSGTLSQDDGSDLVLEPNALVDDHGTHA